MIERLKEEKVKLKTIRVFSKRKFIDYVNSLGLEDSVEDLNNHKVSIISIEVPEQGDSGRDWDFMRDHYFELPHPGILNLEFYDVSEVSPGSFTPELAQLIKEFLDRRIFTDETEELIIHCAAGKSRSYAIGEVIYEYLVDSGYSGINFPEYKLPSKFPNPLVRGELMRLYYWNDIL